MKGSNYLAAAVFTGWDFSAVPRQANPGAKGHQYHCRHLHHRHRFHHRRFVIIVVIITTIIVIIIVIITIIVVINIVWDIFSLLISGV